MRIVTLAELLTLPSGTVYCETRDGDAFDLIRKGETAPDGWFPLTELLPQATLGRDVPWWQGTHLAPPDGYDKDAEFFVFDPEDVATLVERLTAEPGTVYGDEHGEEEESAATT